MELKPVLRESLRIEYVSESEIVKFIFENSNMKWFDIIDYIRKIDIMPSKGNTKYWDKHFFNENSNTLAEKWILKFFNAHPWIDRIMIVFND